MAQVLMPQKKNNSGTLSTLGSIGGTALGAAYGGPMGAAIGGGLGGIVGGKLGDNGADAQAPMVNSQSQIRSPEAGPIEGMDAQAAMERRIAELNRISAQSRMA